MCRIARRLRMWDASPVGAVVEILAFAHLVPNAREIADTAWRAV